MSICPGCENEIEENDGYVTYFGALWHVVCATEDDRINTSDDINARDYE